MDGIWLVMSDPKIRILAVSVRVFLHRIRPHKDQELRFSASSVRTLDETLKHERLFLWVLGRCDGLFKGFSRVYLAVAPKT